METNMDSPVDKKKIKIFKPALGFDLESKIAYVAIPVANIDQGNKPKASNKLYIINSKKECWPLIEEEFGKRDLYPEQTPQFALGETRWANHYIKSFLKDDNDDIFNPYLEVFLPIKNTLEDHIDFNHPLASTLISIWIMGTYIFPLFEAYPYLLISGTRGAGKSKLLEIINILAFNAELTSNASPSSLFRIIESNLCTILIDEGESLTGNERDKDILYILNAGYKKNGTVTRTNKDTHQVEKFKVYSPKVVAAINPLDPTLKSRFISVILIKTGNKDKGNKRVNDQSANWEKLRDGLYQFALLSGFDVHEVFNKSSKINLLNGRNNELWTPILAIAEYLDSFDPGANLFLPLARFAKEEEENTDSLDDWHLALLDSLNNLVTTFRPYLVGEVKKGMAPYIEDSPELERITGRWVGNALHRLGFKRAPRKSNGAAYYINPDRVKDLRVRYELDEVNEETPRQGGQQESPLIPSQHTSTTQSTDETDEET